MSRLSVWASLTLLSALLLALGTNAGFSSAQDKKQDDKKVDKKQDDKKQDDKKVDKKDDKKQDDKKVDKKDDKKVDKKDGKDKEKPIEPVKKVERPRSTPAKEIAKAHGDWVYAIDVSPDGKYLASTGRDKIVKIWTVAD